MQLYNESIATLEQLSILRAWAKVYICAIEQWKKQTTSKEESSSQNNSLLVLVEPSLSILIKHWFAVLRDFSILSLPQNILDDLKESGFDGGGTFFTADSIEVREGFNKQIRNFDYFESWSLNFTRIVGDRLLNRYRLSSVFDPLVSARLICQNTSFRVGYDQPRTTFLITYVFLESLVVR